MKASLEERFLDWLATKPAEIQPRDREEKSRMTLCFMAGINNGLDEATEITLAKLEARCAQTTH